jgi:predicted Rossmann fold nucleotide-binding protein DprA/Smf involved in DNA uptake
MTPLAASVLRPLAMACPESLIKRIGVSAPRTLQVIGPEGLLEARKVALFCSARTPGEAILRAHDAARRMRDQGVTVISGFHSPIEKECLKILLRGRQPIIICPGRAIESMRVPSACRAAFDAGRVLFLSPFTKRPRRVTKESALRRNEIVAALADEAYVAHIDSGGKTDQIVRKLAEWKVSILRDALQDRAITG